MKSVANILILRKSLTVKGSPRKAWNSLVCSFSCFACCQEFSLLLMFAFIFESINFIVLKFSSTLLFTKKKVLLNYKVKLRNIYCEIWTIMKMNYISFRMISIIFSVSLPDKYNIFVYNRLTVILPAYPESVHTFCIVPLKLTFFLTDCVFGSRADSASKPSTSINITSGLRISRIR